MAMGFLDDNFKVIALGALGVAAFFYLRKGVGCPSDQKPALSRQCSACAKGNT